MQTTKVKFTLRTNAGFSNEWNHEILEAEVAATDDRDQGDAMMLEARRICTEGSTAVLRKRTAAAAAASQANNEKKETK